MSELTLFKSKHAGIDVSSSKILPIARYITGKKVDDALSFLHFNKKKASGIIYSIVKSAVANGLSNSKSEVDSESLYIKEVLVGQGRSRKWRRFKSKGSTSPILRRTSNVTIFISEQGKVNVKESSLEEQSK